jgi:hypothetical protein
MEKTNAESPLKGAEETWSEQERPGFVRRVATEMFGIDLRGLAVLRIALASLVLLDLLQRARYLTAQYTDDGVLPRAALVPRFLDGPGYLCLHLISGGASIQAGLFLAAALFAIGLLLGWRTRLCTVLSWFLLASLHSRNPIILQGGDTLLRMMLFWGIFLPLGRIWSVDKLRRQGPALPQRILSTGTLALLLQVAMMYWFSAFLKTDASWARDHTAVFMALSLDHFATPLGKSLLPYHEVLHWFTRLTIWVEAFGPVIAFAPQRWTWVRAGAVAVFVGMHASMALCLHLGFFPFICAAAWLAFLPGAFWDLVDRKSRRFRKAVAGHASRWIGAGCDSAPVRPTGYVAQIAAGVCMMYVLLWNIRTVAPELVEGIFPSSIDWFAQITRVDQRWDMFSPAPLSEDGWFVMPAQLRDGTEIDAFRGAQPVRWEKPRHIARDYPNDRWRKYLVLLAEKGNSDLRIHFVNHLKRQWNKGHPPARQIACLDIYLMMERTIPGAAPAPPRPILLWSDRPQPPESNSSSKTAPHPSHR